MLLKQCQNEANMFAKIIISSATSLLECVNDLLHFIGMEKNQFEVQEPKKEQFVDYNVRTLVKEVMDIASIHAIANENLKISESWNKDGDILVVGNLSHTKRILLNLVSNAIKFTPKGNVAIDVAVNQASITFQVIDSGTSGYNFAYLI